MENQQIFVKLAKLPPIQKVAGLIFSFIGILVALFFLLLQGQIDSFRTAVAKEETLKTDFLDKKKQAVNLSAHKQQRQEIEQTFGDLLQQLPNKAEVATLLKDVNQAGVAQGLEFEIFRPAATERKSEFYAEQPVQIRVSGSFHKFGAFAEEVSRLSRIVNIDDINLSPAGAAKNKDGKGASDTDGARRLTIDATARTYRYLDASEMVKAEPKGKGAKGKKGKAAKGDKK